MTLLYLLDAFLEPLKHPVPSPPGRHYVFALSHIQLLCSFTGAVAADADADADAATDANADADADADADA